jgi:predicted amidohydrolase
MKVAAYQAPLGSINSIDIMLGLIREQIEKCESEGVEILCCPEGVLGGLADYVDRPAAIAVNVQSGELEKLLAPLASDTVTAIVGFTEIDCGSLYNSAAVFHKGAVTGIYRKLRPAINRSVYTAGTEMPVFTIGGLTFGIVICYDSNFSEPVRAMASQGAAALFVPTNNGLPEAKGGVGLIEEARNADIARATENGIHVIRADVAGRAGEMVSYGSTSVVAPDGTVLRSARQLGEDLIMVEIEVK